MTPLCTTGPATPSTATPQSDRFDPLPEASSRNPVFPLSCCVRGPPWPEDHPGNLGRLGTPGSELSGQYVFSGLLGQKRPVLGIGKKTPPFVQLSCQESDSWKRALITPDLFRKKYGKVRNYDSLDP